MLIRRASASAMTCERLPHTNEPFFTFSLAASKWPARQPIASVGLELLQFIALKTFVAFVKVSTL